MPEIAIAHVKKNDDGSWAEPHLLKTHIDDVAKLAEQFSAVFLNGDWGRIAGQWHDL